MATLGELSVLIGAEVNEAGFSRAVSAIGGIEVAAKSAGTGAAAGLGQVGAAADAVAAVVDKASQRIADSQGRIRDGYGQYVKSATLAAEAAGNVGGSLGNLSDMAGRTSSSINSGLVSSFAAFDKAIEPLNAGIGRLGSSIQDLGGGLTTYVTVPLTLLGAASLKSAGDIQALEKGFAATYEGSEQLGVALAKVQELAKLPGLGLEEALQGATNLQAAGFSADLARRALGAFGNALATVGKGKADLDGVGLALGQIASKGKISAEEINQLAERVPQIRKAMQAAFGTADTEVLQKLGISATAFVEGVTTELEKLPKVTGGINNAFENLADAGTISLSKIGGALNRAFDVEGVLAKLADLVTGAATAFERLDPGTQKLIFGLAAAAAAAGPLLFGFGAIVAAIPSVLAGLEVLGLASTAALGPLGIGVAAVAVAAALIISNWDALTEYFSSSGEGGRVFADLADSIGNSVTQISAAFSSLGSSTNFGDLISASGIIKAVFRDIAVGVTALSNVVGGTIGAIVKLFSGDFAGAVNEAERALAGLTQPLASVFGYQVKLAEASAVVGKGFEGAAGGGGIFGDELLHLSGLLPGLNSQLQGFAGGFPKYNEGLIAQSGLLETLRKRLEAVKDAREKETRAAAIGADNKLIDSLQKQIDALLGVSTKGVTDALSKLRDSLRDNGNASRALGADYDYNGNRAKILESGIKSLTDAGFAPGGKVVQEYVRQLREVPKAFDQIQARAVQGSENLFKTPDFKLNVPDLQGVPDALNKVDVQPFGASLDEATARMALFQKTAEDFSEGLSDVLVGGFANIAIGFGEAIGQIISGASGLDALPAVVLAGIGDLAVRVGELAIGVGIAVGGIKAALESLNPVVAIAAGVALVALGSAVKSYAGGLSTGGGSGSAGASLASQPRVNSSATSSASQQPLKITAEFVIKGRDLVAVGRVASYRELRTN